MRLSPSPDLGSNRRLTWTAVAVTLVVIAALAATYHDITTSLGDSDDALRLVRVRELLAGAGWYDQWTARLQPPRGLFMHWSRLLDGALAGLMWLVGRLVSPDKAELAVRFVWPLLWIGPAVACALFTARRLGGQAAVFVCALLLVADMQLYSQFKPGRVDHHNIQIVMALVATTCALAGARRPRLAILAGVASALGLCVGIEALPFLALAGVGYAAALAFDPGEASTARAYGLSLSASAAVLFLIQTPPARWSLSACDAVGLNLVAALCVAGLGLAAVSFAAGRSLKMRLGLLALVGAAAGGAYLTLDPACIHGPMAAVDPRIRGFWFDYIQEVQPWPRLIRLLPKDAIRSITMGLMGMAAAAWLAVRALSSQNGRGRDWRALLSVAAATAATAMAASAYRAEDYAFWFGVPVVAVAMTDLARRLWNSALLPTTAAALVTAPMTIAGLAALALPAPGLSRSAPPALKDHCLDTAAYAPLAALPPGLTLGQSDFGAFVLANTRDGAVSAPYHRMAWGLLAEHEALGATPAQALAKVRALHAAYVLDCPSHGVDQPAGSLAARLRAGDSPPWLERVSAPGAAITIYAVKLAP